MVTMSNSLGEGVNILVTKGTFFAVGYFASVSSRTLANLTPYNHKPEIMNHTLLTINH